MESNMELLKFKTKQNEDGFKFNRFESILKCYSIEVMPRTAQKISSFRALLPEGTRVYIAHLEGTTINEMVQTARRLMEEGYQVMPHFPARIIQNRSILQDWILMYRNEANVEQALLLAGSASNPYGEFYNSMQLLETGLFDANGFKNLHIAGHPEGNRDIDPDGSSARVDAALVWKQKFSERTDASMALATQFAFDAKPIIDWANGIKEAGIDMPIHIGIAGPAKLQTLIKFAISCGIGPSLKVLQKRARDVSKLLLPYEPDEVLNQLSNYRLQNPDSNITQVHFFPLGGIKATAEWVTKHGGLSGTPAVQSAEHFK